MKAIRRTIRLQIEPFSGVHEDGTGVKALVECKAITTARLTLKSMVSRKVTAAWS